MHSNFQCGDCYSQTHVLCRWIGIIDLGAQGRKPVLCLKKARNLVIVVKILKYQLQPSVHQ
jgi:hypothetical protein